jgi:inositol-pentakisphosphate 2-kinase
MTKPSLLELPPGVQLVYLAEGGANVIYRFVPSSHLAVEDESRQPFSSSSSSSTTKIPHDRDPLIENSAVPLPAIFKGKLLRLRKQTASDLPYKEIVANFNTKIRPLFPANELVDQTLIRLPTDLIPHCNESLRAEERDGSRPAKRHGSYLCLSEPFGLLITDMTVLNDPSAATLAEFKPKWLLQSPSAPASADRCRTCALREMKNRSARGGKEVRSFCPLDLVSERFEDVLRAATFVRRAGGGGSEYDRVRLAKILFRNSTLRNLLSKQKSFREVGLLGPEVLSRENSLDMTLRDCTMFVKVYLSSLPYWEFPACRTRLIFLRFLATNYRPWKSGSAISI